MRFYNVNIFVVLTVIFIYFHHGIVSGLSSFKTSNPTGKHPWLPMPPFSRSQHTQKTFYHENITSKGNNITRGSALPVLPQNDDLLTSKGLQELYQEAYLLLKDVLKARKLNKDTSTIDIHVKRNPKGVFIHNKTSSLRQSKLLGQSPLPPFKTRQKNTTSFPVTNNNVTATIYSSKISNFSNSDKNESKANNYFRISTVDQANFIQTLLGKKWISNRTQSDETSYRNRRKQFMRKSTEWNNKKTQLSQNKTKDNDRSKNTTTSSSFDNLAKPKTHSHNPSGANRNSSRLQSSAYNRTSVLHNLDHPSNLSQQYNLLTQEVVVESGDKRDRRPDDTCSTGAVKYNQTLTFGLNAGQFTEETRAKTMEDCISHCCSRKSCDVVFMLKESCFLVKCHNKSSCYSRQAKSLSFNPRLTYVFRHTQNDRLPTKGNASQKPKEQCSYHRMIQNMTLHGGLDAGLFTLHGDVKTLDECTKYCCNDKHCDIAFMVDDACYSVQCKDEESCTPVETSLSKTKVSLAFISRGNRQPIIDIGELKPLSRPVEEQPETTWFCKNSNTSKILTNVKLRGGLKAGNITNKGAVTNYHQCVGYCCQDKHCNVAMTIRNNCFLVACKSYSDCLLQEATDLHSQVVYVNWETPTDEVLTKGKILLKNLGCWNEDERLQSLRSLEGTDDLLMDSYKSRRNAIIKCAKVARKRNFKVFALHNGGECRSGHSAGIIYRSHGRSRGGCHKGIGDHVSNHVYHMKENGSVADHGCWKAIQREENFVTLESTDGRVKDIYKGRNDSLLKCAEAAISQQYTLFALRDGGQCSAGNLKSTAYKKHGVSKLCTNGLGSASSKNVYQIIGTTQLFLQQNNKEPFLALNTKKRQHARQNNFVESKLISAKLPYKHSSPQARIFTHGLKAGHFTHQGDVNNMAECIQYCGQQLNCSAAFMVRHVCFTVQCYSKRSCDTAPAVHSGYNPKLSFITHLPPAMTSYKEKTKLYERRPLAIKFHKNRQQKVNKSIKTSAWESRSSNNSNNIRYKHSSPQARIFTHGLKAGYFTHQGDVNNMAECIQYCGQQLNCSAAFMVRHVCFTVKCYSKISCDTAPAVHSEYNPKLSFITHLSPTVTSQPALTRRCERSKIYENVTLFGGINAGNFTDFGQKENMNQCISSCCQKKHCDVAFMLGNDCYGVMCKTKHLCGTTPAKHVKKYRPRLAYMHSDMENNTADSQSLSSCWNGQTLVNYTLKGGIEAGIFYSNGNTDTMTTCMKYCCEQHDCDLAFRIDQGCYTVHCNDQEQCRARKARKTLFLPQIAFKRPEIAMDEAERQSTTDTTSKAQHGSCQIGETHFNATLKMGIHSGKFKKLGRVDNMEDCVEICCKENDVDAAFMLGKLCYSVKCYNSDLCQIRPAFVSSIDMLNVNPAVAFIHNNDHKDYTRSEIERRCEGTTIKENTTLLGQLNEGTFIDNGERSNIQDCILACCNTPSCDVAMMNGKKCFSVQCSGNTTTCQEVRADSSLSTSTIAYVARYVDTEHTQELELSTSSSQCPRESLNELHVYKNKTLLGGFETGNYTFLGRTKSMRQCIQRCCSRGKCDVAYSIDGNCYGIECFSENLCHVDDGVPDTTSTEISILKDLKEKQPRRLSSYILPVLSVLLAVLFIIAWLFWIRSRKLSTSKK